MRQLVPPAARRVVVIGFGISGAAAMVIQVLWTRALAVLIGSSIYSFTLILLAFPYLGLVLGGLKGEWLEPANLMSLFRTAGPAATIGGWCGQREYGSAGRTCLPRSGRGWSRSSAVAG